MTSFETSMNKKACQKHRTILAFMTVDYLSRAIVFGFGAFILNRQDNGKSIIGLCIFCIYCNRVMLFWFTFFSRGYVYPMEEGKPHTSTSFTYKFLFAFFPAAFVQVPSCLLSRALSLACALSLSRARTHTLTHTLSLSLSPPFPTHSRMNT